MYIQPMNVYMDSYVIYEDHKWLEKIRISVE